MIHSGNLVTLAAFVDRLYAYHSIVLYLGKNGQNII